MVRLRRMRAYRNIERSNTRKSKFRKKSFVKYDPHPKITKFNFGNPNGKFKYSLILVPKSELQIRDSAIESGRQTCNKLLEETVGKENYKMTVRVYPHHILREHALASGAGADRLSTGMAHSFGKPTGVAAQVSIGQPLLQVEVDEVHLETAKKGLHRAGTKMPCKTMIIVKKLI
jgi:large subunit ribosomal protein L10e